MANAPLILTSAGKLKELPLVTTVGATGSDAAIPTEQAVREALSAHSHAYADITSKPATFPPAAHSHAATAYEQWTGNGAASRTLTLSTSIMPTIIIIFKGSAMYYWYWITIFGNDIRTAVGAAGDAINVSTGSVVLKNIANTSGELYTLLAWGNAS